MLPAQQPAGAEQLVQQGSGMGVVQPGQGLDRLHLHIGRGGGRQVALRQAQQAHRGQGIAGDADLVGDRGQDGGIEKVQQFEQQRPAFLGGAHPDLPHHRIVE